MATWKPAKKDTLEAIAGEILHNYRQGRFMIAVDGIAGAGTSAFADELADALRSLARTKDGGVVEVVRASVDPNPGVGSTAEEVYRSTSDPAVVRSRLVEPFRSGGAVDMEVTSADDAILVVDGVFLLRPELRGAWNYSLWLNEPRSVVDARFGDSDADSAAARRGARDLYWRDAEPRTTATAIVDNADPEHPRRVFADSC